MSSKKKVQFNSKRKVKKFQRNDEEENDYEDNNECNLSDQDELIEIKKPKHKLDSDEEDDTDKYEILRKEALKGIS